MDDIYFDKEVENLCKQYDICPTEIEKNFIKLAMQHGIYLKIQSDINKLNNKIKNLKANLDN